jgi:hypothetical protein
MSVRYLHSRTLTFWPTKLDRVHYIICVSYTDLLADEASGANSSNPRTRSRPRGPEDPNLLRFYKRAATECAGVRRRAGGFHSRVH